MVVHSNWSENGTQQLHRRILQTTKFAIRRVFLLKSSHVRYVGTSVSGAINSSILLIGTFADDRKRITIRMVTIS